MHPEVTWQNALLELMPYKNAKLEAITKHMLPA
jgi:hypothetical protein